MRAVSKHFLTPLKRGCREAFEAAFLCFFENLLTNRIAGSTM